MIRSHNSKVTQCKEKRILSNLNDNAKTKESCFKPVRMGSHRKATTAKENVMPTMCRYTGFPIRNACLIERQQIFDGFSRRRRGEGKIKKDFQLHSWFATSRC